MRTPIRAARAVTDIPKPATSDCAPGRRAPPLAGPERRLVRRIAGHWGVALAATVLAAISGAGGQIPPEGVVAAATTGAPAARRTSVAVLGFRSASTDDSPRPWPLLYAEVLRARLGTIERVRLVSNFERALADPGMGNDRPVDTEGARALGRRVGADWVVWGECSRGRGRSIFACRILRVASSGPPAEAAVAAAGWPDALERLATLALGEMRIEPTGDDLSALDRQWRCFLASLPWNEKLVQLSLKARPLIELERAIREAIGSAPATADFSQTLVEVLRREGKTREAEEAARAAIARWPESAVAHRTLGLVLGSEGLEGEAECELSQADSLDPDDAETLMGLGYLHWQEGRVWQGADELAEALTISPYASFADQLRADLADLRASRHPAHVAAERPRDFAEASLLGAARGILTAEEMTLLVNPLHASPEMQTWARRLTARASDQDGKARALFLPFSRRARQASLLPPRTELRTAEEVFAAWGAPGTYLCCQDLSLLYVACARAVGLDAYFVSVEEADDGSKAPHACAAVFIRGKALLVDAAGAGYGVRHRRFTILDDLQAAGCYRATWGSNSGSSSAWCTSNAGQRRVPSCRRSGGWTRAERRQPTAGACLPWQRTM